MLLTKYLKLGEIFRSDFQLPLANPFKLKIALVSLEECQVQITRGIDLFALSLIQGSLVDIF